MVSDRAAYHKRRIVTVCLMAEVWTVVNIHKWKVLMEIACWQKHSQILGKICGQFSVCLLHTVMITHHFGQYLLVCASSWIASVVKICILCLVKGSRHHQNSVVLCFTELPVMHSHYGNNPLLHSSSNLLSYSGKIASSQLLPKVSYHSVTYSVLKILHCLGRKNCIEIKAVYHFCLPP